MPRLRHWQRRLAAAATATPLSQTNHFSCEEHKLKKKKESLTLPLISSLTNFLNQVPLTEKFLFLIDAAKNHVAEVHSFNHIFVLNLIRILSSFFIFHSRMINFSRGFAGRFFKFHLAELLEESLGRFQPRHVTHYDCNT